MSTLLIISCVVIVVCGLFLYKTAMELKLCRQSRDAWEHYAHKQEDERIKDTLRKDDEIKAAVDKWATTHTQAIRDEAIKKSKAVILGQVSEHLAPFIAKWPYNAKDVRFIGNPIDFVIFDGLTEGKLRKIVLMEVKTNQSQLNTGQRSIRDIVNEGKVSWEEIRLVL